ncbi:MAG TPA: rod shape-determining protein MreD [Gammaproteobacteria bacterium]
MTLAPLRGGWVIVLSLALALMLAIVPLPEWGRTFRPDWPLLVLAYWCLAAPQRVGVGISWLTGLCVDVLGGSLLGEHALGYALVAYLVVRLHLRIRVYPMWQQAVVVLVLLVLNQLVCLWILGITGRAPESLTLYLAPSLLGMLLWPWLFSLLRELRRRFAVA